MAKKEARITVICLGSELLDGNIIDTNSKFIARTLQKHGFRVRKIITIPDEEEIILKTFEEEFQSSNLLITTGGLGPTFDDITISTLAKFFKIKLSFNRFAYENIAKYFKSKKRKIQKRHKAQAFLPQGCKIVVNRVGVCPALFLENEKKAILSMPGVPAEMEGMFESSVIPFFRRKYHAKVNREVLIRTTGASEIVIESRVLKFVKKYQSESVSFGIYPRLMEVCLKIKVSTDTVEKTERKLKKLKKISSEILKKNIYGYDDDTLASVLAELLLENRKTISIAESCTGGWISKALTDIPGVSKSFMGGVVVYRNEAKIQTLGVLSAALKKYGAVSSQIAGQLARNVRDKFGSDYGISVTGIAGPTGGSKEKPVGLVFIGIASPQESKTFRFRFAGDRGQVREKTVKAALFCLINWLKESF